MVYKGGRRGGLMVICAGLWTVDPWPGHCAVFLGKTLHSHSASLHPGVQVGTGEIMLGDNPVID